ncbi:hypothetical protein MJO28_013535 [Puccinia striiformis f. sp. tritici]|uniref:Uncharacterized protein n=1 Tax=Puccinia striiformis f. sp. tritici TaxID=168172 RepID=A0ACC0DW46_9BASI|nr:hypothetical protein MJO28_013535 [Puccinia striiformis f. sp. tritici]KAI7941253.1 hypothetical protein MJO29_013327 [Puccinia striiformis f. sp. tritici]
MIDQNLFLALHPSLHHLLSDFSCDGVEFNSGRRGKATVGQDAAAHLGSPPAESFPKETNTQHVFSLTHSKELPPAAPAAMQSESLQNRMGGV